MGKVSQKLPPVNSSVTRRAPAHLDQVKIFSLLHIYSKILHDLTTPYDRLEAVTYSMLWSQNVKDRDLAANVLFGSIAAVRCLRLFRMAVR